MMTREKFTQYAVYAALAGLAWYLWKQYAPKIQTVESTSDNMLTISESEMKQAVASFGNF